MGDDPLAQVVVGLADDRGLPDAHVLEERGLDLAGADAVAAGLDQVDGAPTDDPVVAAGVDHRGVAGAEPAVRRPGVGGRLGPAEVAVEEAGPLQLQLADGLAVVREQRALVLLVGGDQPRRHPGDGFPDPARAALAIGPHRQSDHGLAHPVPLDRRLAGQLAQALEDRHGQRRAARDEQARRAQDPGGVGVARDARPDRRDPEQQAGAVVADGGGVELRLRSPDVHQAGPDPQRAEHPEPEPVHVEQGQAVGERVVLGPLPGVGETVEARGHRRAGEQHALGRAGGPRRVEDQRRTVVGGLASDVAAAPGDVDLAHRQRDLRRSAPDPERGARVREHVPALARPGVGRDRDDGHAGEQGTDHRHDRLGRRLREDRDGSLVGPVDDLVGDHGRGADQLGTGHGDVADPDRLGVVEAPVEQRSEQRRHGAHHGHRPPGTRDDPAVRGPPTAYPSRRRIRQTVTTAPRTR